MSNDSMTALPFAFVGIVLLVCAVRCFVAAWRLVGDMDLD